MNGHRAGAKDLWSKVRFDAKSGAVWLDEQRMLLLHSESLAALRAELIRSLGEDRAAGLLMRMGYHSGVQDAEIARRLVRNGLYEDVFLLGPALHQLEGVVEVETVHCEIDVAAGHFKGEFIWHGGWEADAQLAEFGTGESCTCWNQVGYATGYVSAFLSRRVHFSEIMCRAKGDPHCRIIGEAVDDAGQSFDPFRPDDIAGQISQMAEEIRLLRAQLEPRQAPTDLVGRSSAFLKSFRLLERATTTDVTVLLLGETGVGKEVFAKWLHEHSRRREKPFVAVNCGAIPHDLIESELFGAEAGAYTGATKTRDGRFARADGGTLFLDEIGDLPLAAQVKLLRVLQTGEVERLGGGHAQKVAIRLVAATNVDLYRAVAEGRFRADLFYRLNPYPIEIPPLRDRAGDIPLFVEALLKRLCTRHGRLVRGVSDRAMSLLGSYSWPGNIRELENVLERGVILAEPGSCIDLESLSITASPVTGALDSDGRIVDHALDDLLRDLPDLTLEGIEERLIAEAVRRSDGDRAQAAALLGLSRRQLDYRCRQGS